MRRRVVVSGGVADLAALILAIGLGSLLVYSTPWLWQVRLGPGELRVAHGGLSLRRRRPWLGDDGAAWGGRPRPSYGRATTIALIALASVAIGTLVFRTYWSRAFIPIVVGVWLGAAFAHRFVRRRRPWAESMVVVSAEKETVDQLAVAPHARVVNVLDPGFEGELEPLSHLDHSGGRPAGGAVRPNGSVRLLLGSGGAQRPPPDAGLRGAHRTAPHRPPGRGLGAHRPRGAERPLHPAEEGLRHVDRARAVLPIACWSDWR